MGIFRRKVLLQPGEEIARDAALAGPSGRHFATLLSATALALSLYSLWESSLRPADIHVYVPPVIQYAAPYQNSNFEMIAIPVTVANEGAQTGTLLSMELAVTDPRSNETKHFYSADFGRWTMERTRSGAYQPFAPISLAGHTSRTESVLFYTRGEQERPEQLIREPGTYQFALRLEEARSDDGLFARVWPRRAAAVTFERDLRNYDARAFNTATLPLYAKDWRSAMNQTSK
jgi:hypothetical protein